VGEVITLASVRLEKTDAPRRERKPEPRGFFLVPRRVLSSLARFEASVDAFAADIPSDISKRLDWLAYYETIACLEDSARYD
jgi:hypothetical protein